MKKEQKNSPNLRFKGFTEDWELCKLGNIVTRIVREVPKPKQPYERISVRSHAKGTFHQKIEDPSTVAMDKLYIVKENDLIVNITFAWEHAIAIATKEDDGLFVSHRFPTYRTNRDVDIKFIHYLVSQENFRRKLEFISPGGAGRNRVLNKKDFLKIKVNVPNVEEQKRLGVMMTNLDQTIALHQRKLDQLKELKKAYLQVMFPEKDERVPKLRFADFEEEWELCKFSDILETHSTKKYLAEPNKNGEFEVIQQGDNPIIGYATGKAFLDYNKIVLFGDHTLSLYKPKRPFFVATDGIKILSGKNTIGKFLFTLLQRYMPNSQGYKRHFTILKNENIYYTSTDTEQLEIGDLFLRFDILTTYYQDRIINLKKLKKSYLQNMFI